MIRQMHNIFRGLAVILLGLMAMSVGAQTSSDSTATIAKRVVVPSAKTSVKKASSVVDKKKSVDVKELIFSHVGDTYEWHITKIGNTDLKIELPIIVYSKTTGWHLFNYGDIAKSGGSYNGFSVAPAGSRYEGKIVEYNAKGAEVRPFDFSITKVTLALFINAVLLVALIMGVAQWYRKHPDGKGSPGGFVGFMEMFIMMINDDVIKNCVGERYRKFSPYLLTAFFFIFLSNIMGLIPFFPGGVTITGNTAITLVLALFTFVITNFTGSRTYWKDIFWPDVPLWLKVPIPIIPFIEFFGIFTKPFALMIRLFGNMLAGHMGLLVFTSLIFITASINPFLCGTMSFISVLFSIFMDLLEVLIAFLQAYVFTLLSAAFIGLAQEGKVEKA